METQYWIYIKKIINYVADNITHIIIHYRDIRFWVVNMGCKIRKGKNRTNNPTGKTNTKTREGNNNNGKNHN